MKFQLATVFFATLAAFASAAPTGDNTKRADHERHIPDVMVQIHEAAPYTAQGLTHWGKVARINGWNNVQTLVSIPIPNHVSGKTCSFVFTNPKSYTGSKKMQLFTVGDDKPINEWTSYNHRPYRDQHVADIYVEAKHAKFTTYGKWNGNKFDCPAGKTVNYELVPVGDHDEVTWELPHGFAVVSHN